MHMKKLRILWSKSPAHTAEIFQQLRKQHRQDPDLDKIAKTGKLDDDALSDDEEDFSRFLPVEFLKRLPGVETSRLKELIRKGKQHGIQTVVDICESDLEKLSEVFGAKQAREIKQFLERKVDLKEIK